MGRANISLEETAVVVYQQGASEVVVKSLSELTVEEASEIIMHAYRRKYTPKSETEALALLIVPARRMKPELLLAKVLASEWLFEFNRPEFKRMNKAYPKVGQYKRILRNPPQVNVLLIPRLERGWLLLRGLKMRRLL